MPRDLKVEFDGVLKQEERDQLVEALRPVLRLGYAVILKYTNGKNQPVERGMPTK